MGTGEGISLALLEATLVKVVFESKEMARKAERRPRAHLWYNNLRRRRRSDRNTSVASRAPSWSSGPCSSDVSLLLSSSRPCWDRVAICLNRRDIAPMGLV